MSPHCFSVVEDGLQFDVGGLTDSACFRHSSDGHTVKAERKQGIGQGGQGGRRYSDGGGAVFTAGTE